MIVHSHIKMAHAIARTACALHACTCTHTLTHTQNYTNPVCARARTQRSEEDKAFREDTELIEMFHDSGCVCTRLRRVCGGGARQYERGSMHNKSPPAQRRVDGHVSYFATQLDAHEFAFTHAHPKHAPWKGERTSTWATALSSGFRSGCATFPTRSQRAHNVAHAGSAQFVARRARAHLSGQPCCVALGKQKPSSR